MANEKFKSAAHHRPTSQTAIDQADRLRSQQPRYWRGRLIPAEMIKASEAEDQ